MEEFKDEYGLSDFLPKKCHLLCFSPPKKGQKSTIMVTHKKLTSVKKVIHNPKMRESKVDKIPIDFPIHFLADFRQWQA